MKRKVLGIPIRSVDFSNTSQVVSLFTREAGLVEGLAKGAHREKNPFQGPFDLAVLYQVLFVERSTPGLALLTEATVWNGYRALRRRWERYVAASHVLEFLRAVATAGEAAAELFDLVHATFEGLGAARDSRVTALLMRFDLQALRILGLFAPAPACAGCRRAWSQDDRPVFFSPRAGGLLCGRCRRREPAPDGASLSGAAMRVLYRLANGGGSDLAPLEAERNWEAHLGDVTRAVTALRTNLLERELVLLKSSPRWLY